MVMLCGYDQETEDAKEKGEIIEITKIEIYQPENQHGIHYDCHRLYTLWKANTAMDELP
jgi:hypothetical protein